MQQFVLRVCFFDTIWFGCSQHFLLCPIVVKHNVARQVFWKIMKFLLCVGFCCCGCLQVCNFRQQFFNFKIAAAREPDCMGFQSEAAARAWLVEYSYPWNLNHVSRQGKHGRTAWVLCTCFSWGRNRIFSLWLFLYLTHICDWILIELLVQCYICGLIVLKEFNGACLPCMNIQYLLASFLWNFDNNIASGKTWQDH